MSSLAWLDNYSVIGSIQKPHGVHGEVKVKPEARSLDRISQGQKIYLANPKTKNIIPTFVTSLRSTSEGWIIKFDHIRTREQIPEFRFFLLLTDIEERPELDNGQFYYSDLDNLKLINSTDQEIGVCLEVIEYPSVESLSCKINNKSVLIPWIEECVLEINLDEQYIRVDLDYISSVYDIS